MNRPHPHVVDSFQALEGPSEMSKREKTSDVIKRANEKFYFIKEVFEVAKDVGEVAAPYITNIVRLLLLPG